MSDLEHLTTEEQDLLISSKLALSRRPAWHFSLREASLFECAEAVPRLLGKLNEAREMSERLVRALKAFCDEVEAPEGEEDYIEEGATIGGFPAELWIDAREALVAEEAHRHGLIAPQGAGESSEEAP